MRKPWGQYTITLHRTGATTNQPSHTFVVDHATLHCWVIRLVPLLDKVFRRHKRPVGRRWRMDETHLHSVNATEPTISIHSQLPEISVAYQQGSSRYLITVRKSTENIAWHWTGICWRMTRSRSPMTGRIITLTLSWERQAKTNKWPD